MSEVTEKQTDVFPIFQNALTKRVVHVEVSESIRRRLKANITETE